MFETRGSMEEKQPKTLFLVRHAESEQNVATRALRTGQRGAATRIIELGWDAPLSAGGREQLEHARETLKNFVNEHQIELVVHSPLVRAADTARALFGGSEMLELDFLYERSLSEYFVPWLLDYRIGRFASWLATRTERRICVVGHGQYFKRATRAESVQRNVGIVRCAFVDGDFVEGRGVWPGFPPATPKEGVR